MPSDRIEDGTGPGRPRATSAGGPHARRPSGDRPTDAASVDARAASFAHALLGAPAVAAFDLDETLIRGPSRFRFLRLLAGPVRLAAESARTWLARRAAAGDRSFGDDLARATLAGRPIDEVRTVGEQHARALVEQQLGTHALEPVALHRALGHRVVLVTNALDVYADAFGRQLGFDAVLARRVEAHDGVCTGTLGREVAHVDRTDAIRRLIGPEHGSTIVFAYGGAPANDELRAMARASRARLLSHDPVRP